MTTYIVCYDLKENLSSEFLSSYKGFNGQRDYTLISNAIQSYGSYCHFQKSVWFIKSDKTAAEIYNNLLRFIVSGDSLLVSQACLPAKWLCGDNDSTQKDNWLENNLH